MLFIANILRVSFALFLVLPIHAYSSELIDFTNVIEDDSIWKLDGSWDFYWQELLDPDSLAQESPGPIAVGRPWNGQINTRNGMKFAAFGYGTYELKFKGLQWKREGYEFGIRSASSSFRAFIYPLAEPNQYVMIENGQVGSAKESTVPSILPQFVHFHPRGPDEVWVIRIQVANFHDSKGGLWTFPTLSIGNSASRAFHVGTAISLAASGMALIIAFYNFMLFYRRREDKPSLFLALFCLTVSLRNFATSDIYSYLDQRQETWIYQMKWLVEYLSILLASWTLAAFYFFAFESRKTSKLFTSSTVLTGMAILSVLVLPIEKFTKLLTVYQAICSLSVFYILSMMVKCLIQKRGGSRTLLLGGFIFMVSTLYDVGVSQGLLPLPYTNQFATVIFIFLYSQLIAARFSKAFRTSERLQRSLREEVERQTAEIRSVMEHIPQGIFVMDRELKIKGQYARFLEDLFGRRDLSGLAVPELIFDKSEAGADTQSIVKSCLFAGIGESLIFWDLNQHQLPREITRSVNDTTIQIIEFNWHPIVDKYDNVNEVLVSVRDITELKQLQKQSAEDRLYNDMILELLALKPGFFTDFWSYSSAQVEKINPSFDQPFSVARSSLLQVLPEIHSWKGLSRAANFRVLTDSIHDLESRIQAIQTSHETDHSPLLEVWNRIRSLLESYRIQELRISRHSRFSNQKDQKWTLMSEVLEDFHRDLESLASELSIPTPRLMLPTTDFKIDQRASMAFKIALIQLGRNSLVHGIESPAQRLANGKARDGLITLEFDGHQNDGMMFRYYDDGPGLSLQKIAEKAYEKNLVEKGRPISSNDALKYIMHPEFSTADQVSMIAGRGMGMMAICQAIEQFGGTFHVQSDRSPGKEIGYVPISFIINLPLTLIEPVPGPLRNLP